ncbi:MAG: hypothetical protein WCB49_03630 [Gammaproteobacteria bacterium]
MVGYELWKGERFRALQWFGFGVAVAGLVVLVFPGLSASPLGGTAGDFLHTVLITILLSVIASVAILGGIALVIREERR